MLELLFFLIRDALLMLGHLSGGSFPKPLSRAEEAECLQKMQSGDENARSRLIEHNLRLVAHVVKKYTVPGHSPEDLVSVGTLGLIKAVNSYKMEASTPLSTYAARCIENEILMHIRKISSQKAEISLDEPINTDWDGNELLLSDILGTDEDLVMRPLEQDVERRLLREALSRLPERDRYIICRRFGLDGKPELTQKEVADLMGISQSYISRLEKRIMTRLRKDILRQVS